MRRLVGEYVLINNIGDSVGEQAGDSCGPIHEKSHHDHLIFEITSENLHFGLLYHRDLP